MRVTLDDLLTRAAEGEAAQERFNEMNIPRAERNNQTGVLASILKKAMGGDISAAAFIRDTVGDKAEKAPSIDRNVVAEVEALFDERKREFNKPSAEKSGGFCSTDGFFQTDGSA